MIWDCKRKYTRSADFCADRIGGKTNFAVITNVVTKRVHCIQLIFQLILSTKWLYRVPTVPMFATGVGVGRFG